MEQKEAADRFDDHSAPAERLLQAAFVAALMLIVMLAGALLTAANVFPGPQVAPAYQGGKALYNKLTAFSTSGPTAGSTS